MRCRTTYRTLAAASYATAAGQQSVKLAADGLDSIATTELDGPTGLTWPQMLVALFQGEFLKNTLTSTARRRYKTDGTQWAEQTVSDAAGTQTQGNAS